MAVDAAREALDSQERDGRWLAHFERRIEEQQLLRAEYAALLGCAPEDVALTTSASEGLGKVLAGMNLGPGDEILTSDQEHPGLIGPLIAARDRGAEIRMAPLASLASAVSTATTAVACSHVGWLSGELVDPGLSDVDVPVILDGAQGAGAIPVDPVALGCDVYAAAGQKWCCGADGTGMLYVAPAFRDRVAATAPAYLAFEHHDDGLDSPLYPDARRHDTPSLSREGVALSLASMRLLASFGWADVHARGRALARDLVDKLTGRGFVVGPRGETTLVSFETEDPLALRETCNDAGIIVRNLPGTAYVRVSTGAWNDESDLERLLTAI